MRIDRRPPHVALLLAFAVTGCASSAGLEAADSPSRTTVSPGDPAEMSDLEAAYWARQQEAQTRFVQADVDFMTGMIGHHAQALVMSALAPDAGGGQAVKTLAARIANAQRDEIETMQTWLRDRGQPVPVFEIEGTVLTVTLEGVPMDHGGMDHAGTDHADDADEMDHGGMNHGGMDHGGTMHDHSSMPGMLSQAQLDRLAAAQGAEFDRLFLEFMIQHHGGAVVMVEDLFEADGAGQDEASFRLASDVQVDQRTEIARMQQMLDAMTD
ncbi:DUF305 domain-containing protein [Rubrivirga sp.]|uniref:DUF305 domain-containing protein n=1 Tax=Rubrivirga sp. TaxID=1885344 RepID=UPI003C71F34C